MSSVTYRFPVVELRVINPFSGEEDQILQSDMLQGFKYEFGVHKAFTATFDLFDPNYDFLENLIHGGGFGTVFKFRWGWSHERLSPWYEGLVKYYETRYSAGGESVNVVIQSPYASLSYVKRDVVFPGEQTVDDAVHAAALAAGIPEDDIVIEPTNGERFTIHPWTGSLGQTFRGWLDTIKPLARPRDQGSGSYEAWFREDGKFEFSTTRYGRFRLYDAYVFGFASDGRVLSVSLSDQRPMMSLAGAGENVVRFANPDDPDAADVASVAEREARERGTVMDGSSFSSVLEQLGIISGGQVTQEDLSINQREAEFRALQRWRLYAEYNFIIDVELIGDPLIRLRDTIYLRLLKRDGTPHYMSGYYTIRSVEHDVSRDNFVTRIQGIRSAISGRDLAEAGVTTFDLMGSRSALEMRGLPAVSFSPELGETGQRLGRFSNRRNGRPVVILPEEGQQTVTLGDRILEREIFVPDTSGRNAPVRAPNLTTSPPLPTPRTQPQQRSRPVQPEEEE